MTETVEIERILFASDFSSYSDAARDWAITLARKWSASVVILHVVEGVEIKKDPELKAWFTKLKEESAAKLEREVGHFRAQGLAADGSLKVGRAWETIVHAGTEVRADIIVIGSHGLTTPEGRFLLGTTSHKVILVSKLPVLIARGKEYLG